MSHGILTPDLVKKAYEMVLPLIEEILDNGTTNRKHLSIVVAAIPAIRPSSKPFDKSCYLVTSLGDKKEWECDYQAIALSKAALSARTSKGTAELGPQYLLYGDTIYYGSVVLDGIVVACAGVESYYDEMIAMWIAATIKALCKEKIDEYPEDRSFISQNKE